MPLSFEPMQPRMLSFVLLIPRYVDYKQNKERLPETTTRPLTARSKFWDMAGNMAIRWVIWTPKLKMSDYFSASDVDETYRTFS